ncbi:MAG: glycosyltransferase [Myxococcaceae bacterium]
MAQTQRTPVIDVSKTPATGLQGRPYISVVIPVLNSGTRLSRTLVETLTFLRLQKYASEIVVIDDASSDASHALATAFARESNGLVRALRNPGSQGRAFAVQNGVLNSHGDVVFVFDAELRTPLGEIHRLLRPLQNGDCDVVLGCPTPLSPPRRNALSRAWARRRAALENLMSRMPFAATQSRVMALTHSASRKLFETMATRGPSLDTVVRRAAAASGLRVLEMPVQTHAVSARPRALPETLATLADLLRLRLSSQGPARAHPRFVTGAAIRVLSANGEQFDGCVGNVSRGGLFLLTDKVQPPGSRLTALLPMPSGDFAELPGRVVHVADSAHEGTGMGVEFGDLSPDATAKLERFLGHVAGDAALGLLPLDGRRRLR